MRMFFVYFCLTVDQIAKWKRENRRESEKNMLIKL